MSDVVYPTNKHQVSGNLYVPKDQSSISSAFVTGTDSIEVDSGGVASDLAAILGGTITINDVSISNLSAVDGGTIVFNTSGTIDGLVISGGYMSGGGGATINNPTLSNPNGINGGGYLVVYDGTVNGGTVSDGGTIVEKSENTVVSGVAINSGGHLTIEHGTATNNTVGGSDAIISLISGTATGTTVNGDGKFYVNGNGSATTTTVAAGGDMSAWGSVSNTTLNDGKLTVFDGGTATTTTVSGTSASLYVNSNATAYGNTIDGGSVFVSGGTLTDGGQIRVSAGGVISSINTIDGNLYISAGGSAVNTNVTSGFTQVDGYISGGSIYDGKIQVNSGGVASGVFASGTNFDTQGTIEVDGGTVIDPITHDYGNVTLITGTVQNLSATGGGITMNGGTLSGGTFQSGATMTVSAGAVTGDITIGNNGHANVSGGTVSDLTIESGGSGAITGGSVADVTVSQGGTINFDSGATLTDTLKLASGGTASITGDTGGTVELEDGYTTGLTITGIDISKDTTVSPTINGWTKESQVDLQFVKFDNATWAYSGADQVKITLESGKTVTLNIPGVEATGFNILNDGQGGTIITCFLIGSMIRTSDGDVAVENIQIGDQVVAFDWENNKEITRPVVWVGKSRAVVRSGLPDDEAGYPVRILKDAIADGVPYKDMLITSEHCMFFEGKFVPVRMLVNGVSIFYDKSITSYDYYHVETAHHSVITADGMRTESYLDTGNRSAFRQNGRVVSLGLSEKDAVRDWTTDGAAPLSVARDIVEPIFRNIEKRASAIGESAKQNTPMLTDESDLHLVTEGGQVIRAARRQKQEMVFMLPVGVEVVRLVSRTSRPSDTIGPFVDDRRHLGVLVGQISLFDGDSSVAFTEHLENADLSGWDVLEGIPCRWTNGNAVLPVGASSNTGLRLLSVQILASGPYQIESVESENMQTSLVG